MLCSSDKSDKCVHKGTDNGQTECKELQLNTACCSFALMHVQSISLETDGSPKAEELHLVGGLRS